MSIPNAIKCHRPTQFGAVEIRNIGRHYYVYLVSSKWDPEKRRPQKVTGKSIGKITESDGFIPNANGMRLMQDLRLIPSVAPRVRNYGAYEVLRQLSPELDARLKEYFPDIFWEIRTISLLRLVDSISSAKMIQPAFLASYMSDTCSDIAMSESSVRKFIAELGCMQGRCESFMKSFILPGTTLLFDGTTIFTRSGDSLSEKGYNPNRSLNPQARILYVFEKDTNRPIFYRVLQGSMVDKSAFIQTIKISGCKDCIIIADKGFYSKRNLSALMAEGMKYILPLQDNTTLVDKSFYENSRDDKWDGIFSYKTRPICYKKCSSGNNGNFIYTFCDEKRKASERGTFVEKAEKDFGEEERKLEEVFKEFRLGYFSFCSNLDVAPEEIYLSYKQRWDIEQCFDYLKNNVSKSASYAHKDDYFRGWAFLNHISLLYFYGLINMLHQKEIDDGYSASDVLALTKNIYLVDVGDGKGMQLSEIQKKTQELMSALKINLLRNI